MTKITRREHCRALFLAPSVGIFDARSAWTAEWDRAVIEAAVARADASFDPGEMMLKRSVGPEYRYHTNLRSTIAHPTRDSLDYALLLLEAGGGERTGRALRIIERVVALQETDPDSKWYGLWGYYLEEPAPKMAPADWNWADFNGSLLLLTENRHGGKLPESLRRRVREAIRHAANSVRRRNVSMNYTNIAVQGTFVTLAAAELLDDDDLRGYGAGRLRRFAENLDVTGSFAEYNSPTYANVTIANLTRMRQTLRNKEVLPLVEKIHQRAWMHLGKHWHAPTAQLAGPHSRSYRTDIGAPLWLQKALGGRLRFATLDEIRRGEAVTSGEVGLLDYACPSGIAPLFLTFDKPRQHREIFLPAQPPIRPLQGTTWMERDFCLGSANRGDFWVQRRPLLAYWGGAARPARYVQLRFIKDDYDFASALLYTVQERGRILGLVNFRSPGGDKHPGLDPVQNGEFKASRLRLVAEISGAPKAEVLAGGERAGARGAKLPLTTRLALDLPGAKLWMQARSAVFGVHEPSLSLSSENGVLSISFDLLSKPGTVRWRDMEAAYLAFTLSMEGAAGSLKAFDERCARLRFQERRAGPTIQLEWAELGLHGATNVNTVAEQDRAFAEFLNGEPVPAVRLSEEKLA